MPENRVESVRKQGSSARTSPDATVKGSKRRTVVLAVLFRIESAQDGVDRPSSRVLRGERTRIGSAMPRFSLASPRILPFSRTSASEATRNRSRNAPHSRPNCLRKGKRFSNHLDTPVCRGSWKKADRPPRESGTHKSAVPQAKIMPYCRGQHAASRNKKQGVS